MSVGKAIAQSLAGAITIGSLFAVSAGILFGDKEKYEATVYAAFLKTRMDADDCSYHIDPDDLSSQLKCISLRAKIKDAEKAMLELETPPNIVRRTTYVIDQNYYAYK